MLYKGYAVASIDTYEKVLHLFNQWLEEEGIGMSSISHTDLLEFVNHLQKRGLSRTAVNSYLIAVQHYLQYHELGIAMIKNIRLIGKRSQVMIANVLKYERLLELYDSYETPTIQRKRNKVILGLMVFQGLPTRDISKLRLEDVNIEKGVLRISATKTSNGRVLELHSKQILSLHGYIETYRPVLLDRLEVPDTSKLFFAEGKNLTNLYTYLARQLKEMDMRFISFHQIKASVFHYWLQNNNLRKVQHMAGHKYVSSTEKYKDQMLNDLEDTLDKFHPMGS